MEKRLSDDPHWWPQQPLLKVRTSQFPGFQFDEHVSEVCRNRNVVSLIESELYAFAKEMKSAPCLVFMKKNELQVNLVSECSS